MDDMTAIWEHTFNELTANPAMQPVLLTGKWCVFHFVSRDIINERHWIHHPNHFSG